MKRIFILCLFIGSLASCAKNKTKNLSEESTQLLKAMNNKTKKGNLLFLKKFPKDLKSFTKTCNSPKFNELYDCHLQIAHLTTLSKKYPQQVGDILASLASVVKFDADAPNHLKEAWLGFCNTYPKFFSESVNKLPLPRQNKSLSYVSAYLYNPNSSYKRCQKNLIKAGYKDIANKLEIHKYKKPKK